MPSKRSKRGIYRNNHKRNQHQRRLLNAKSNLRRVEKKQRELQGLVDSGIHYRIYGVGFSDFWLSTPEAMKRTLTQMVIKQESQRSN